MNYLRMKDEEAPLRFFYLFWRGEIRVISLLNQIFYSGTRYSYVAVVDT